MPSYYADGTKVANSEPAFPFDKPEHTLISYFGRLNYSYKDRYLLTATMRRDGSSRFGPENKWGYFPSAAVAWNINEEDFLKQQQNGIQPETACRLWYHRSAGRHSELCLPGQLFTEQCKCFLSVWRYLLPGIPAGWI